MDDDDKEALERTLARASDAARLHAELANHSGATIGSYAARRAGAPTFPQEPLPDLTARASPTLEITAEVLGEGGMGVVKVANQLALRRRVAVKTLRDRSDGETVAAALREARVTGGLEHPSIVPVYMLGSGENGEPLIVMRRIEGTLWSRCLTRHPIFSDEARPAVPSEGRDDPLGWHLDVLLGVTRAVAYAHSHGVLHRDLKPDNVIIGSFGELYLLDWGLAVSIDDRDAFGLPRAQEIAELAGTPGYMAPEMARCDGKNIGPHTDVYLLGAILFRIANGRPIHRGSDGHMAVLASLRGTRAQHDDSVPRELREIVDRATHPNPAERIPTAQAFLAAVEAFSRQRNAMVLVALAEKRAAELEGQSLDRDQAHAAYLEVSFAVREAERTVGAIERTDEAADRATAAMVELAMRRGDVEEAARLAASLRKGRPELVARVKAAQESKERWEDAAAKLGRDADESIGRGPRVALLAVVGTGLGLGFESLGLLARFDVYHAGPWTYFASNIGYGLTVLCATITWRHALLANAVNRRFLALMIQAFLSNAIWLLVGITLDLPLSSTLALVMCGLGTTVVGAGVALKPLFYACAVPYALGAVVAVAWPAICYDAMAVANVLSLLGSAAVAFVSYRTDPLG